MKKMQLRAWARLRVGPSVLPHPGLWSLEEGGQKPVAPVVCQSWAKRLGITAPFVVFTFVERGTEGAHLLEAGDGAEECDDYECHRCRQEDYCIEDPFWLTLPYEDDPILIDMLYPGLEDLFTSEQSEFSFTFTQHEEWQDLS